MPDEKEHRIRWSDEEWDRLAEELYCIRPIAQYQQSDSLASLTLLDMQEVQKVLTKDRWRDLKSVATVRPKMQEAMRRLRAKLKATQERQAAEEAERIKREAEQLAAEAEAAKPNPFEAALAPLVALISTEVGKQVQDMLNKAIEHAVSQALSQVKPQVEHIAVNSHTFTPDRLKFGIIGPMGVQADDIRRSFPDMDFVIVESSQQRTAMSKVVGCDAIIGMTDFMDRAVDSQMRAKFLTNYHRTPGGVSAIKRMITVMVNSMRPKAANGAQVNGHHARHH